MMMSTVALCREHNNNNNNMWYALEFNKTDARVDSIKRSRWGFSFARNTYTSYIYKTILLQTTDWPIASKK